MSCIFCEIIKGNIPAKIVDENEKAIAFLDINPIADGHTIIISKQHYQYFSETPVDVLAAMTELCKNVAHKISKSKLKPWGFNYLCNENKIAGQEVMHVHMHVIPKYGKDEGFKFGKCKNIFVNDIDKTYNIIKSTKI